MVVYFIIYYVCQYTHDCHPPPPNEKEGPKLDMYIEQLYMGDTVHGPEHC